MTAMFVRCRFEHRRDEKTIQHPIENSDLICLSLMMLIRWQAQIQKRKLTRTLNSYWMKFFDEQRAQHRWYFYETQYMKTGLFRDFANTLQKTKTEKQSEFRYMMKTITSCETDLLKLTKKLKFWMIESLIQTRNSRRLNLKDADCEAYHSIRTICWFLMFFDSISFHVIWFNMMRIADDTNLISFRFELILRSVKKNEAMNMQSISRDSNETRYSILNQSDWIEKKKTSVLLQISCFNNIKDTMQKKWLLKLLLIKQCWRMCSNVCEWLFKNTEQSKTKRPDFLKSRCCSKTRKCSSHRDIETMYWLNNCWHSQIENTMTESTQCFSQCNSKTRAFLFLHFRKRWEENLNDIHQFKKPKLMKSLFVKEWWWCFWMKSTKIEKKKDSRQKSRCLSFENTFRRKKTNLTQIYSNMLNQERMHLKNAKKNSLRYFYS